MKLATIKASITDSILIMPNKEIKVKAMCLFMRENKFLFSRHKDNKSGENYYRPLGGGMEFQELSEDTIKREIQEELGAEIEDVEFVEVLENIFEYKGEPAHQIIFIYSANFVDETIYQTNPIPFLEADLSEHQAEWVDWEDIQEKELWLVPKGIKACIHKAYGELG